MDKRQLIRNAFMLTPLAALGTPLVAADSKLLAILAAKTDRLKKLAGLDGSEGLYKAGQAPGAVTGQVVKPGFVGEVFQASFEGGYLNSVAPGRASIFRVPSAGIWMVHVVSSFTGSATLCTQRVHSVSLQDSLASTHTPTSTFTARNYPVNLSNIYDEAETLQPIYLNLDSPTNLYVWGRAIFSGGTCKQYGYINAVRVG